MRASPLTFAGTLAVTALLLHATASLTACGGGGSSTGGGATTTSTGGTSTTSTTATTSTTSTTTGTGDGGTGGSAGDAGSDGGGDLCTQTGGSVTETSCNCPSVADFPSTCAVGACSCAPGQSHTIKTCTCGASQCFDPTQGCRTQV